jgi:hypothetical protein
MSKDLFYALQMIAKSKDAEKLIQDLQKLAIQGVFIAEKVSKFGNLFVTFHNCMKFYTRQPG